MDYEESLQICINELKEIVKINNGITMDKMYDNAIYPENKELKSEFIDDHGFDEESFILYLIKRSEVLELTYDEVIKFME